MLASNIGVTWVRDIRRKAASRGAAQLRFWGCDPMNGAKLGVLALLASSAAIYGFRSDTAAPSPGAPNPPAHGVAAATSRRVDNFMLVDAYMEGHELYRLGDASPTVLVTQ